MTFFPQLFSVLGSSANLEPFVSFLKNVSLIKVWSFSSCFKATALICIKKTMNPNFDINECAVNRKVILCLSEIFCWLWGLASKTYLSVNTGQKLWHILLCQPHPTPTFFPLIIFVHTSIVTGDPMHKQTGIHQLVLSARALCKPFSLLLNISF